MKGDFLGFSFDGIHCSELGITHVSSSDRYDEELFPEVRDKTIEIPNNHGEYYYGSTYGTRTFEIEFAYDSVTEVQFRKIRKLFGTRRICNLIFDERPYKVYHAKIESPVEMSYICFDEEEWHWEKEGHDNYIRGSIDHKVYTGNKRRIYKGEGKVSLICYFPFATQLFKTKELYAEAGENSGNLVTTYNNVDEWIESSGILDRSTRQQYHIDRVIFNKDGMYQYVIPVYNPGDLNTGFCLYLPFNEDGEILPLDENSVIIINGDTNTLLLDKIVRRPSVKKDVVQTGVIINTINHLIEGVNFSQTADQFDYRSPAWESSGNIYNDAIKGGDFPQIRRSDWWFDSRDYKQSIRISYLGQEVEEAQQAQQATETPDDSDTPDTPDTQDTPTEETPTEETPTEETVTEVESIGIYYDYLYF